MTLFSTIKKNVSLKTVAIGVGAFGGVILFRLGNRLPRNASVPSLPSPVKTHPLPSPVKTHPLPSPVKTHPQKKDDKDPSSDEEDLFFKLALQRRSRDKSAEPLFYSIHGFYIQYVETDLRYQHPNSRSPENFDISKLKPIMKYLVEDWYSIFGRKSHADFLQQQWARHGRYTLLGLLEYFELGLTRYKEFVKNDETLGVKRGTQSASTVSKAVSEHVYKTYGKRVTPEIVCYEFEKGRVTLTEIRLCMEARQNGKWVNHADPPKLINCPTSYVRCKEDDDIEV